MSKVFLLGAGPGDPGLVTVRAREVLAAADVVVYDYLANPSLLGVCRPDAELIYVGKKGGDHTLPQDKINELIVDKAGQGLMVARLKGGDPYVFGRGAEEAEELLDAGIDFEVVPGVTSAVAASAYAGIPLTHRRYASSVSFITGHEDPDKPESVHNWEALARGTSTLVFFMGIKNLPHISKNLIQAGMDPDTPAALVRWGTTCRHRSWTGTVGTIADLARKEDVRPPSLLVVGHVVRLRDKLNFFERRPLLGRGVVVTRARHQASSLKALLEEMGACCLEFPTIEIRPLTEYSAVDETLAGLEKYAWIVFTSVNGVVHFWDRLKASDRDARSLAGSRIAAIGPATAQELRARGIEPDFVPPKYVAESIVEGLLVRGVAGERVLIPRAAKAREVLPEELSKAGALVHVLPVYETVPAESRRQDLADWLDEGRAHCITFTSSSTVENFFSLVSPEILKQHRDKVRLACIGPVTADTLREYGFSSDIIPKEYTVPALADALSNIL